MDSKTQERLRERLIELRKKRGFTQAELARRAKISPQIVKNSETRTAISPANVARFAKALGVDEKTLYAAPGTRVRKWHGVKESDFKKWYGDFAFSSGSTETSEMVRSNFDMDIDMGIKKLGVAFSLTAVVASRLACGGVWCLM